tara:strand:- start:936 stop:1322 length:387 start_codon:yes stop_codon:yes gene_type:complete
MNSQIREYYPEFKAILAIDFDLTICMSHYPKLGLEREGAGNAIRQLVADGYGVIINTCRDGLAAADAIHWLDTHNIPYHFFNCNFPHVIQQYSADCRKISADMYIDDKCLMGLPHWNEIHKIINKKYE